MSARIPSSTTTPLRRAVKRRFPGPAGILPILPPKEIKSLAQRQDPLLSQQISKLLSSESELGNEGLSSSIGNRKMEYYSSSQDDSSSSNNWFEAPPWIQLLAHLKSKCLESRQSEESEFLSLMSLMNIKWIRTKIIRRASCKKIPFLVVVLQEAPEIVNTKLGRIKAPKVTLVDPSGSIEAVIDCKFLISYSSELVPGTCLALRNVGILRLRRKFLLTITENNLIYMSSAVPDEDMSTPPKSKSNTTFETITTDFGDTIRLRTFTESEDFSVDQFMEEYHKINQSSQFVQDDLDEVGDDDHDYGPGETSFIGRSRSGGRTGNSESQSTLFSTAATKASFRSPAPAAAPSAPVSITTKSTIVPLPAVSAQNQDNTETSASTIDDHDDMMDDDDAAFLDIIECIDFLNEPDVF